MFEIKTTKTFNRWLHKLKDTKGKISIARRIERISYGYFGDTKMINSKISELRINYGPGYRVYYTTKDETVVILLIGGDKSTQKQDIEKAKVLYEEYCNG